MMTQENYRILVVDDTPSIHEDFRKILLPEPSEEFQHLEEMQKIVLGKGLAKERTQLPPFVIDSAFQSAEALTKVKDALKNDRPYAVAFVDVVMPPGTDGILTIKHMWEFDREIQIVICTAYANYSVEDILKILGTTDRLFILKKPFDSIEIVQLALTLTKKWNLSHLLAERMGELKKTAPDTSTNADMAKAIESLKQSLHALKKNIS